MERVRSKESDAVPDIYTNHVLTARPDHTILGVQHNLKSMARVRILPMKPINVIQYAASNLGDKTNAGSVWFIGALEHKNMKSLRAYWGIDYANLHNDMATLVNF